MRSLLRQTPSLRIAIPIFAFAFLAQPAHFGRARRELHVRDGAKCDRKIRTRVHDQVADLLDRGMDARPDVRSVLHENMK